MDTRQPEVPSWPGFDQHTTVLPPLPGTEPPRGRPLYAKIMLGAGRTVIALVSVVTLTLTAYGWTTLNRANNNVVTAPVLNSPVTKSDGTPLDGSVDILLVGLDSRTDARGNPLPDEVLDMLNASEAEGTLNTDTMMVVHIPQDGKRVTGISFPRDAYVEIAGGFGKHKINSAYARAMYASVKDQKAQGVTDPLTLDRESKNAGRRNLIKTIENLTGGTLTIDRFAEVNLLSFYELTKTLGGVTVCLNEAVDDKVSGAAFPAGEQTLDGAKAIRFVRQRYGLPRGDLDRVVRQQVFLSGLIQKILSAGTLVNPGKLTNLVDVLTSSVVLSEHWNLVQFGQQMQGLTGDKVQFVTIPTGDNVRTPDGSSTMVDLKKIKDFVAALTKDDPLPTGTSTPSTPVPQGSGVTVDVINATETPGVAARALDLVSKEGFARGTTGNGPRVEASTIRHAPFAKDGAQELAGVLTGAFTFVEDPNLQPGHVQVTIGMDHRDQFSSGFGGPRLLDLNQAASQRPSGPITAGSVTCVN